MMPANKDTAGRIEKIETQIAWLANRKKELELSDKNYSAYIERAASSFRSPMNLSAFYKIFDERAEILSNLAALDGTRQYREYIHGIEGRLMYLESLLCL